MYADEMMGGSSASKRTLRLQQLNMKPAINIGLAGTNVPDRERSMGLNTQNSRNMNSKIPREEKFYDKE